MHSKQLTCNRKAKILLLFPKGRCNSTTCAVLVVASAWRHRWETRWRPEFLITKYEVTALLQVNGGNGERFCDRRFLSC